MKITYDDAKWTDLSIKRERHDGGMYIQLPGEAGGFYVGMDGEDLVLMPERSAAHRQLVSLLCGDLPQKPDWATW